MADADHDQEQAARNSRNGLILFAVYCALYATFIGISAFKGKLMSEVKPFGGVNLAIVYGFGLIVAALILAVIYMRACKSKDGQS